MNIYAKPGAQVYFTGENGHDYEQEEARRFFKVGQVLTVSHVKVGGFSSKVYFDEVPGEGWNTVMFEDCVAAQPRTRDELEEANRPLQENFRSHSWEIVGDIPVCKACGISGGSLESFGKCSTAKT